MDSPGLHPLLGPAGNLRRTRELLEGIRGNLCLQKPVNLTVLVPLIRNNAQPPQQA